MTPPKTISIAGITVHNTTLSTLVHDVQHILETNPSHSKIFPIFTINPEFVVDAQKEKEFKKILNTSFRSVPDGMGIMLYGLLHGTQFNERITGIDLINALTKLAAENGYTVGFLGGKPTAAEKTLQHFQKKYTTLKAWADEGPQINSPIFNDQFSEITIANNQIFDSQSRKNISDFMQRKPASTTISDINKSIKQSLPITNILFVAFGAPKQEYFIEHLKNIYKSMSCTTYCIGVGGSFDEIAGLVHHCPAWIERMGMKWLFRLLTEPWRWRRQLKLIEFARMIIMQGTPEPLQ